VISGSNTPPLRFFFGINVENGPKSIKTRRAMVPKFKAEVRIYLVFVVLLLCVFLIFDNFVNQFQG